MESQEFSNHPVFHGMTNEEMRQMFEQKEDRVEIKPWIKEGITWRAGDAGDPQLLDILGPQDMVVASNFLCHMDPPQAEQCLRNIVRLVNPGGYIFVSGIDLDVRAKVARDMGWKPVADLIEEVHDGDHFLRDDWPWKYWGLEPFDKTRSDRKVRYAAFFRIGVALERADRD